MNLLLSGYVGASAFTILSWASAHGRSQLKPQTLGVGGYTEEVLEWFDCPHTSAHPGCKVSCRGVLNRPASWLCLCFNEASPMVEKAMIVLESRPTRSLIAKRLQRSSLAVRKFRAASEERCKQCYGRVFAKL